MMNFRILTRKGGEATVIILLGPDGAGKTTLAKSFDLPYYHFTNNSKYEEYIIPLSTLGMVNAVLDRHMICEYPYAEVMGREFQYSMKQWHNVILLTLAHNPVVVLCTHKPTQKEYAKDQYMPYDKWDECLELYRFFLKTHQIRYIEYDYNSPVTVNSIKILHNRHMEQNAWWTPMWKDGVGYIGSAYPKVLLVAERLGPNNMSNLPFETGPTGKMLTEMLVNTKTPLGKFAVTNLVKAPRRDTRNPNIRDYELLDSEILNLKPEKVVFMGGVAKLGMKVAKNLGVEYEHVVHFGYFNHKRIAVTSEYHDNWRRIMGITP